MLVKLLTCLFLLTCFAATAQHNNPGVHTPMQDSMAAGMARLMQIQTNLDSLNARQLQRLKDEAKVRDSINMVRSLDELARMQKERDQKLTRQLWIKGSMFILMLGTAIIGAARRRRQHVKG